MTKLCYQDAVEKVFKKPVALKFNEEILLKKISDLENELVHSRNQFSILKRLHYALISRVVDGRVYDE